MKKWLMPHGPFTPLDIPGLKVWYDASDASSITESGGVVSQWNDKGPLQEHLVQATGIEQPIIDTVTLNGLRVMQFDGDDWMQTTFTSSIVNPVTFFIVAKRDAIALDNYFYDGITSGTRKANLVISNERVEMFGGNAVLVAPPGSHVAEVQLHENVYNGTSSTYVIDGTTVASGNAGTSTLTGLTVGAAFNLASELTGFIAEIVMFNGTIEGATLVTMRDYLNNKWGL